MPLTTAYTCLEKSTPALHSRSLDHNQAAPCSLLVLVNFVDIIIHPLRSPVALSNNMPNSSKKRPYESTKSHKYSSSGNKLDVELETVRLIHKVVRFIHLISLGVTQWQLQGVGEESGNIRGDGQCGDQKNQRE